MISKDERNTDLLAELYDTYQDVKSGKLTLTRVYVLVMVSGLSVFSLLCVCMLFVMQFTIAVVYSLCAAFCYCLLRFRRRRFIARYFDWLAVISSHLLTILAVLINIYLYGGTAGSQLLLFSMVGILYIITLDKARKRFFVTSVVFLCDTVAFLLISWIDANTTSTEADHQMFFTITFLVSTCLSCAICVVPVWISGLFSIEDIERLSWLEECETSSFAHEDFYGCISRRALDASITFSDGEHYKDLNICIFEIVLGLKRNEVVYRVNDFYFARVLKEFATLLRCYFANAKFLIRWDTNTFIVIFERDYESSYKILNNIIDSFDGKIRAENDSLEVFLRVNAKNYHELDTRKRPRLLLDRINDLMRSKHDSGVLGKEYLQMNTDLIDSSRYRSEQ